MNSYQAFAAGYVELYRQGTTLPLGGATFLPAYPTGANGPLAMIFAPHPDDECIIGGLPLRLQREHGWRVKNVAVTLGSHRERRAARLEELRGACAFMGFDLVVPEPAGWDQVTRKGREENPSAWTVKVKKIAQLISEEQPRALFFPHVDDWNGTHIGTHWLVMDALDHLKSGWGGFLVETEFWGQMARPNLMVEVSVSQLADQVAGTSFHVGEVRRNPFHLRLPAWMQDNVRRGSELVGGQGEAAPNFEFATLYRLRGWRDGSVDEIVAKGRSISCIQPADEVLNWPGVMFPK